jgi:hypothetical protein
MELKIAIFIKLTSITSSFGAHAYSQLARVSLEMENKPLENVINEIEKQSEFYFIFNQTQIDVSKKVTIRKAIVLIDGVLHDLFKDSNVIFAIMDRKILLNTENKDGDYTIKVADIAIQQKRVTGTVSGSDGSPLPGVTVLVVGTNTGTITDADGFYSLDVQNNQSVLQF